MALENSMRAFELSLSHADGIELDTQLAKCGTLVTFHDDTLERLFGDERTIAEVTYEELKTLRPVDGSDDAIPKLEDVLDLVPADYFLNVEIKAPKLARNTPTESVAKLLATQGDRDIVVSCFNPIELIRASRAGVKYKLGLLFGHDASAFMKHGMSAHVFGNHLGALHPNWKVVSPSLLELADSRGWDVNVWTVNDSERSEWLKKEGVSSVISDVADQLRS